MISNDQPYELLAGEYYGERHQTSRNFDATTAAAIASLELTIPDGLVLEVGCGRGRSGEFLGITSDRVVQLDNSAAMLALQPREAAVLRVLHDAEDLPFPDREFGLVVAFLCDPFLGLQFLSEGRRVLRPGGMLIATTPSYEWGRPLRDQLDLDTMTTRFATLDGRTVQVPSAIYPIDQLLRMLAHVGFPSHLTDVRTHRLPEGSEPVSKDIVDPAASTGVSPYDLDILYTIVAGA